MTNVYLLSSDADTASSLTESLNRLGAIPAHRCAWLIPWSQGFGSLIARIRFLLPRNHTRLVVVEINGDYWRSDDRRETSSS